jgi:putative membrane protein
MGPTTPAIEAQRVKILALLGLVCGLALATLLVFAHGATAIWHSTATLGWGGFAVVMGVAWWLLGRDRGGWPRFIWGRLIRDSASEALPLSQIGGYVLGARAVTLAGTSGNFSAGSTIVDVTVELVAQLGYILIALVLLHRLQPDNGIVRPVLAAVGLMGLMVAAFVTVQARGAGAVERIGIRVAQQLMGRDIARSGAVQNEIQRLQARPATLLLASAVHLTSWILSGVETYLTLRFMGVPISLSAGLVVDSLLYGMRSVAFMVPNAFGVQESGLVFLCGLFGVGT